MRLEYFQMIDRIVALDLDERTIAIDLQRADARAPFSKATFPAIR